MAWMARREDALGARLGRRARIPASSIVRRVVGPPLSLSGPSRERTPPRVRSATLGRQPTPPSSRPEGTCRSRQIPTPTLARVDPQHGEDIHADKRRLGSVRHMELRVDGA